MFYFNKQSSQKILHTDRCTYIVGKNRDAVGFFTSLSEAYKNEYRLCRCCSPVAAAYRKEEAAILEFCAQNGLSVRLDKKCIVAISSYSKWKITVDDSAEKLLLYHRNTFTTKLDNKSEIAGYHRQYDIQLSSVIDYLSYILEHDRFRLYTPIRQTPKKKKKSTPPKKGTKRYRKEQQRAEFFAKKQAIKNVYVLFETLEHA